MTPIPATSHSPVHQRFTLCRYQISVHPEVEARIIAELSSLGLAATPEAPVPRSFSAADLSKLPYLTLVIKVLLLAASLCCKQVQPHIEYGLELSQSAALLSG